MAKISMILMDIEGTTTDIHFVHKVLFPYALEHMDGFLSKKSADDKVQDLLKDTILLHEKETSLKLSIKEAPEILKQWIREDRKATPLKALQGLIWEEGYSCGELKSHVYEDVPFCFKLWIKKGISLGIYSSGSVFAQKLLFKHTNFGDLTGFITSFFDTNIGQKREKNSYEKIAATCNKKCEEIFFLSDIKEEIAAASLAGMQTALVIRNENSPLPFSPQSSMVSSFEQIEF